MVYMNIHTSIGIYIYTNACALAQESKNSYTYIFTQTFIYKYLQTYLQGDEKVYVTRKFKNLYLRLIKNFPKMKRSILT